MQPAAVKARADVAAAAAADANAPTTTTVDVAASDTAGGAGGADVASTAAATSDAAAKNGAINSSAATPAHTPSTTASPPTGNGTHGTANGKSGGGGSKLPKVCVRLCTCTPNLCVCCAQSDAKAKKALVAAPSHEAAFKKCVTISPAMSDDVRLLFVLVTCESAHVTHDVCDC
jgi:hypothetical protein